MTLRQGISALMMLVVLSKVVAAQAVAATQPLESITLQEAIRRAQSSSVAYATAVSDQVAGKAQATIARSLLLPGVDYHNQFIYTQPQHLGGKPVAAGTTSPIYIANNGVHEYVSQGLITENIGGALIADYRKALADAAVAKARQEVARRGLVLTVVTSYYAVEAGDEKLDVQRRALDEAMHFAVVSGQLEAGGEVAHADVVKANLQVQQRQRDLGDAQLAAETARLDLGVLLFSNPLTPYTLATNVRQAAALPDRSQINAAANANNPDLKAALESFHSASLGLTSAWFAYVPTLNLNYSYGIDAPQFAITDPSGTRNLGYAATATLDIPVWDWFSTHAKVKQSEARRALAKTELSNTQRQLVASIEELYRAAEVAREQMTSLDGSERDASEALRLTNLRYVNGEAPILEVVDAENTLIAVQNSRADSATRYATALANLQTLTGNLP